MDGAEQQHGEDAQGPRVDERPLQPDESGPQMRGDDAATSAVPFLGGPVSPELQRQQAMLFQQAELQRAYLQQLQAAGLPPPGAGPGIGVFNVGAFGAPAIAAPPPGGIGTPGTDALSLATALQRMEELQRQQYAEQAAERVRERERIDQQFRLQSDAQRRALEAAVAQLGGRPGLRGGRAASPPGAAGTSRDRQDSGRDDDASSTTSGASAGPRRGGLDSFLGHPSALNAFNEGYQHYSPEWFQAVTGPQSKVTKNQHPELNAAFCAARAIFNLALVLSAVLDNPNSDEARRDADAVLAESERAQEVLMERFNFFQLLAAGKSASAAAIIADAATFARRAHSEHGPTMAGVPIADNFMADILETHKKKCVELELKHLHDAPDAGAGKGAKGGKSSKSESSESDDMAALRKQLEKEQARSKRLESRLEQKGRAAKGDQPSKKDGAKKDDKKKKDDAAPPGGGADQ